MGYADDLVRLLRPLGFYSFERGSFSLAQVESLGAALDSADTYAQRLQRESIVMTAEEEGLDKMLSLFRNETSAKSVRAKRAAIAGFLQIGGDSFTLAALRKCLSACGVTCQLEEKEQAGHVRVSFPYVMGVPEGFSGAKRIIEDILPCHLGIEYFFHYCTWGETMDYGLTWADVGQMTWVQWKHYTENPDIFDPTRPERN